MLCGNAHLVENFDKARHADDWRRAVLSCPPPGPQPGGVVSVKLNMDRTTQGTHVEGVVRHICFLLRVGVSAE